MAEGVLAQKRLPVIVDAHARCPVRIRKHKYSMLPDQTMDHLFVHLRRHLGTPNTTALSMVRTALDLPKKESDERPIQHDEALFFFVNGGQRLVSGSEMIATLYEQYAPLNHGFLFVQFMTEATFG